MADKWPLANGNWSSAANWNGGTLPQPGDVVYADGKAITIDQNITVQSITNALRSGGSANGVFLISSSVIINANILGNSSTTDTTLVCQSGVGTVTINGNIIGGTGTRTVFSDNGFSATITINGNVVGGSGTNSVGVNFGGSTVTINGNVTGGTNTGANGVTVGSGTLTINGTVTGGSTGFGVLCSSTNFAAVCNIVGSILLNNAVRVSGFAAAVSIDSPTDIIGTGSVGVVSGAASGTAGSGRIKITAPKVIGGSSSTTYAVRILGASLTLYGDCEASATSPAIYVENRSRIEINGNVLGQASNAVEVLANAYGFSVIGDVIGGTTGVGILCRTGVGASCLVVGTVTGGTGVNGFGISNTSTADINILGTTVNNTATAVSNSSTGVVTITPLIPEITMACVELLNVTEDDVSSVQEITGPFDFQANSPEGGTYYLFRALGASVDSEKRDDFQLYKTFTGPANLPIDNTGTNRFKVQLQGTKGVADKIVTVNIQD